MCHLILLNLKWSGLAFTPSNSVLPAGLAARRKYSSSMQCSHKERCNVMQHPSYSPAPVHISPSWQLPAAASAVPCTFQFRIPTPTAVPIVLISICTSCALQRAACIEACPVPTHQFTVAFTATCDKKPKTRAADIYACECTNLN